MRLLEIHRTIGKIFALFFIFASLTAAPLFWRKDGVYSESTKELIVSFHTWEAGAKYSGIILAAALFVMSITGLILSFSRKKSTICVKSSKAADTAAQ